MVSCLVVAVETARGTRRRGSHPNRVDFDGPSLLAQSVQA